MNNINLTGNLVKDPEKRDLSENTCLTTFTVAVNTGWGEKKKVSFIPITAWNKQAELCEKILKKGHKVAITGRLETNISEKDGKTYYNWGVTLENITFLTPKDKDTSEETPVKNDNKKDEINDDEIPF